MRFIPSLGSIALASAILFGQGCIATNAQRLQGEPYPAVDLRAGFDSVKYDVEMGKRIQTTLTHPADDTRLPLTETTAPLGAHYGNGISFDAATSFGNDKELRLEMGLGARYNFCHDGGPITMLEERKQDTDTGSESYAFTRLTQDRLTYRLFIGAEREIYKGLRLGLRAGVISTGFRFERGRDRRGAWEIIESDSSSGHGEMLGVHADFRGFSVSVGKENFSPKFSGEEAEIESFVASLGYNIRF